MHKETANQDSLKRGEGGSNKNGKNSCKKFPSSGLDKLFLSGFMGNGSIFISQVALF